MNKREKLALLNIRRKLGLVMATAADDATTAVAFGESYLVACLENVDYCLRRILDEFDQLLEGGAGFSKLEIEDMIRAEAERMIELRANRRPVPSERMLDL